jgi:hypothetical protein
MIEPTLGYYLNLRILYSGYCRQLYRVRVDKSFQLPGSIEDKGYHPRRQAGLLLLCLAFYILSVFALH